jgi:hypothetical protein
MIQQLRMVKTKCGIVELVDNRNYSRAQTLLLEATLDYKQVSKKDEMNSSEQRTEWFVSR